jgi:chromosome segregation and condensation protein ScpB
LNAEKTLQPEVALLEAILFLENDPIDLVGLAKIAKISEQEVAAALEALGYGPEEIRAATASLEGTESPEQGLRLALRAMGAR